MRWTLKVTKDGILDSMYAEIKVTSNETVSVGIRTAQDSIRVNRNRAIILSAVAYSQQPYSLNYSWSSTPQLPASAFANSLTEKYLKINAYALDDDSRYNFVCLVQDPDGNTGEALIHVIVNRAPRMGNFSVSPARGVSHQSPFVLTASAWYDDDLPLTYLFSYEEQNTGKHYTLGERTQSNTMTTTLGMGKIPTGTATVLVKVEVFDALNASTVMYVGVVLDDSGVNATELIQEAAGTVSNVDKLQALTMASQKLDCSDETQTVSCGDTVSLLRSVELNASSTETDTAVIDVLSSMTLSAAQMGTAVTVMSDIAARELETLNSILSVADDQLESKCVQSGLSSDAVRKMLAVLGGAVAGMSSTQREESQTDIIQAADVVGRSLVKDSVPNEGATVVETEGISLLAQKVADCGTVNGTVKVGSVKGVAFSIPICDVLPVNQTVFENMTLNKVIPYDLLVEVFSQNVMGDCVPLSSKMMRVVIYDDQNKVVHAVTNVTAGINFTFQLSGDSYSDDDLMQVTCGYYSNGLGGFVAESVQTTLLNASQLSFQCSTTHLSEFALMYTATSHSKSYTSFEFWLLLAILLLCIGMHIWAAIYDSRHKFGIMGELQAKTQRVALNLAEKQDLYHADAVYSPFKPRAKSDRDANEDSHGAFRSRMPCIKLLSLVILRTHSLLKIFVYQSKLVSRKACTQMFWNGFFLRLLFLTLYAELVKKTFDWWALVLLGYFTATPLCLVIEMAMRTTIRTAHIRSLYPPPLSPRGNRPATEKVGSLQAALAAKMRLQGKIRALARLVSYIVPFGAFVAISEMYMLGNCSSAENALYILALTLYTVLIHDVLLGAGFQYLALVSASHMHSTGRKMAMRLVLKEVKEILQDEEQKTNPQRSICKTTGTPEELLLRSINALAYRQEPGSPTRCGLQKTTTMVSSATLMNSMAAGDVSSNNIVGNSENVCSSGEVEVKQVFVRGRGGDSSGSDGEQVQMQEPEMDSERMKPRMRSGTVVIRRVKKHRKESSAGSEGEDGPLPTCPLGTAK